MKSALREGTYDTLNIYFQTNLSSTDMASGTILLGFCTRPTNVTYGNPPVEFLSADYSSDGCNILAGTMAKGPRERVQSRWNGRARGRALVRLAAHLPELDTFRAEPG